MLDPFLLCTYYSIFPSPYYRHISWHKLSWPFYQTFLSDIGADTELRISPTDTFGSLPSFCLGLDRDRHCSGVISSKIASLA